jgi:hypothetical protein
MQPRPQKDCSFQESQTPAPTSGLSLPCQPRSVHPPQKGGGSVSEDWGGREKGQDAMAWPLASIVPSVK